MTFEDFKAQMKNSASNAARDRPGSQRENHRPAPDMEKYYEEHKKDFVREEQVFLRQILISTEGKTPEQMAAGGKEGQGFGGARAQRREIRRAGASDNSDDAETAKNFGELPAYKRGQLEKRSKMWFSRKRKATLPILFACRMAS